MATKKAGSAAKKTTRSKSQSTKKEVTTVKAVQSGQAGVLSRLKLDDKKTVVVAALIGEFIGTFLLASVYLVTRGEPLYMGFTLITLILLVGTLSGAHLNPLVSVGAWVTRKLGNWRTVGYVVAQLAGAGVAYVALSTFVGGYQTDATSAVSQASQAAPSVYKVAALSNHSHWYVLFAELLGSTVLAFAFASARREKTDRVAKAITAGFGLFVAMLVAGASVSYVGANIVLNPAVAVFASAVNWTSIDWFAVAAYIVAPLAGGVVGYAFRDAVDV